MKLRKILLVFVLPALVTGASAFLPTLYEQWKQPRAVLTYEATVGPEVKTDGGSFRIGSITVRNAGSKPLTLVHAQVNISNATLQAFSVDDAQLVGVKAEPKSNAIGFSAASLLPGENFSATFLMHATGEVPLPVIAARSEEARGSPPILERRNDSWRTGLTGAILGATSVLGMVLLFFYQLTKTEPSALRKAL